MGFQYTPVASIATGLHRRAASQSASASRPAVVVAKVATSRLTRVPCCTRAHATTVSLCTSNAPQRGERLFIAGLLLTAPRRGGAGRLKSTKRAPGSGPGATVRGAHTAPGQTSQRVARRHSAPRPPCRRGGGAILPAIFHPSGSRPAAGMSNFTEGPTKGVFALGAYQPSLSRLRPPPFRNDAAHDWRAGVPGLV